MYPLTICNKQDHQDLSNIKLSNISMHMMVHIVEFSGFAYWIWIKKAEERTKLQILKKLHLEEVS